MQLQPHQLMGHLQQKLAPIYFIQGDEILLRQEARDAILQAARGQGFQNYQRFEVETHFRWEQLEYECKSFNLFQEKTILEVRNLNSKFDSIATQILTAYSERPATDKILLIISGKLTSAQQKGTWLQHINKQGIIINIQPITPAHLPRWISGRLQQVGLTADTHSIQLLADLTEGNLLACQQAIEKVSLLYPQTMIKAEQITFVTGNNASFNIFELGDYILKGDTRHVLFILNNLQAEGTEPVLILWLLARELRQLIAMLAQMQQGKSVQQVVASQWQQRQVLYKEALNRMTLDNTQAWLQLAHQIDLTIKGLKVGNVWEQILHLSLAIAGNGPFFKTPPQPSY